MAQARRPMKERSLRIAYLINRYPAVSHTFIRREIEGLEALGTDVLRYSIRLPEDLPDAQDRAEKEKTFYILDQGVARLVWRTFLSALRRPRAFWRGFKVATAMAGPSPVRLFRHYAYLVEASFLSDRLTRLGIDHVHAHFGTNPAAVARILHHISAIPYSFTVHGPDEFDAPRAYHLREKVKDAKACIAISSFTRSQLLRWAEPEHWHKIHVVRCGIDRSFHGAERTYETSATLCCVTRLAPQKGMPLLIEACAMLQERGVDFTLEVIGDGHLRPLLEQQIGERGLQEKIILRGWCDSASVRDQLLRSRALVLPSFAEGLPVVLMEALALCRPVVCTSIAGIPELVDSSCGWIVPAGSAEALVEAMEHALTAAPGALRDLGCTGRDRVIQMHNASNNAGALLDILDNQACAEV